MRKPYFLSRKLQDELKCLAYGVALQSAALKYKMKLLSKRGWLNRRSMNPRI